jgi:hypothetical protein
MLHLEVHQFQFRPERRRWSVAVSTSETADSRIESLFVSVGGVVVEISRKVKHWAAIFDQDI